MQVITIFNEKGGVGKTTLTGIIGAGLALRGYRVLLVDADGQGDLTKNMGLPRSAGFFRFVKWAEADQPDYTPLKDIVMRVPPDVCDAQLYIVPGNNDSWGIPNSMNTRGIVKGLTLRMNALERAFDYVIIDTQPSATTLHDGIAMVTDYFLCPTEAEALSAFGGLRETIAVIEDIREQMVSRGIDRAKLLGIIPNKVRENTILHQDILGKLQQGYGGQVFDPIPNRICIPESQLMQRVLMQHAPDLNTNDILWRLVDRIIEQTKEAV